MANPLIQLVNRLSDWRRQRSARGWVIRLDAGLLSNKQQGRFRAWIQAPTNEEAFRRLADLWEGIDVAIVDRAMAGAPADIAARGARRFRRPIAATGMIVALCLGAAWQGDLWVILQADARTGVGEIRQVTLADGSHIFLDSNSAVAVKYEGSSRHVRLLEGRAHFDVAHDPNRPFLVEARGGETRALGTQFVVDGTGPGVEIDAIVHDIAVRRAGGEVVLHPGQSARYDERLGPVIASRPGVDSWTTGALTFDNVRLAEVASSLQRYVGTRLIVIGEARNRRYSGVVRADDALGGLDAIVRSGGLSIVTLPGIRIITAR